MVKTTCLLHFLMCSHPTVAWIFTFLVQQLLCDRRLWKKIYPDVGSNKFYTQMCFKKILKGRIDTNIQRKKCAQCFSNSIVIQFTAMCWNITQNSRKYRSGLWVQRWSTNWIFNWNDSSKQHSDLDCPPECKNLSKWYPGTGATLKAWLLPI